MRRQKNSRRQFNLVPKFRLGTHCSDAPRRRTGQQAVNASSATTNGRGASGQCVPTQSVGTRQLEVYVNTPEAVCLRLLLKQNSGSEATHQRVQFAPADAPPVCPHRFNRWAIMYCSIEASRPLAIQPFAACPAYCGFSIPLSVLS